MGSFQPRDQTHISCIGRQFLYHWATWEDWKWKSLSPVRFFASRKTGVGYLFRSSPGDLPNPRIKLRSPALWTDSLPAEPQGKPKNTGVGNLFLLQRIFQTRNQTGVSCIAGLRLYDCAKLMSIKNQAKINK